jgi:putative ABC transport system permease protein
VTRRPLPRLVARVHALFLLALPRAVRRARGGEIRETFEALWARAVSRSGPLGGLAALARDCLDLLGAGLGVRRQAARERSSRDREVEGMGNLLRDARIGARTLLRRPAYLIVSSLTLAVGIGANAAVFGVVNAVVLRPLPYPEADRLVMAFHTLPRYDIVEGPLSYPAFEAARDGTRSLTDVAAYAPVRGTLIGQGPALPFIGTLVSGGLFGTLGVPPLLGRAIQPADDGFAADPVLVLAHQTWMRVFGGDPEMVGRPVRIGGRTYTVVGVMPDDFPALTSGEDYYAPLVLHPARESDDTNFLRVIARVAPGAELEIAQADLDGVLIAVAPDAEARERRALLLPRHEYVVRGARTQLLIVLGAVTLVLLVACTNVAGLTLTRGAARGKELALRTALGAGRRSIVRHLAVEGALVAACGGLLGLAVAYGTTQIAALGAPADLPRRSEIGLDAPVVLFLATATMACILLTSVLPALRGARGHLSALRGGGNGPAEGGRVGRLRPALASAQIGLALVLLVAASLLGRSLARLQSLDLGFEPGGVLTAVVPLPFQDVPEKVAFLEGLHERVSALPTVSAAGVAWSIPFAGGSATTRVGVEGSTIPAQDRPYAMVVPVEGDYFQAMSLSLTAGRAFRADDDQSAPEVAVISEAFARTLWPGASDVVGRRITTGEDEGDPPVTIVGVAADARVALDQETRLAMYTPYRQAGWTERAHIVIRSTGDPLALVEPLRQAVGELHGEIPVGDVATLEARVRSAADQPRFRAGLVGSFAVVAGLLALIGIYGVMGQLVQAGTREIGVRVAMGAERGRVLRGVLGQALRIAAVGVAGGLVLAMAASRSLTGLLFQVEPGDPGTYVGASVMLLAATVVATLLPARRAARVDPMEALRGE